MQVMKAAQIMKEAYEDGGGRLTIKDSFDKAGVQAYLLPDRVIVVPGTNEFSDWTRYNLNISRRLAGFAEMTLRPGASGTQWHDGFLRHAETLYDWAKGHRPKVLIGHSLGAASVQIVGASLRVPTISFAAPKPKWGRRRFDGAEFVLNILRTDDIVTNVPPVLFRHVGFFYRLKPQKQTPGL
ncbi:MAG: hypothetical protein AAFY03_00510, partial [Pseudomonadota bacterium]